MFNLSELKIQKNKRKGIWFYGLAGSGKTFASKIFKKKVKNYFIIDGHNIRKLISYDLGYTEADRIIQLKRVLGLVNLSIENKTFPIATTVTMNNEIYNRCLKMDVEVVEIMRPFEQISQIRSIYKNDSNVVGKDIELTSINNLKIFNNGTSTFEDEIEKLF